MKQYASLENAKEIAFRAFFWPFKKVFPDVQIAIAGSIMRKKPTVGDIDFVISSIGRYKHSNEPWSWTKQQIQSHDQDGGINLKGTLYGFHTDVWFTTPDEWAPMLLFATGPKAFNIFLRKRAKDQGMLLNPKGLFIHTPERECGPRIDNNTEGNIIWLILHRKWIPPEERDLINFPQTKRVIADKCGLCLQPFIKGIPIIRADNGEWVHEIHVYEKDRPTSQTTWRKK